MLKFPKGSRQGMEHFSFFPDVVYLAPLLEISCWVPNMAIGQVKKHLFASEIKATRRGSLFSSGKPQSVPAAALVPARLRSLCLQKKPGLFDARDTSRLGARVSPNGSRAREPASRLRKMRERVQRRMARRAWLVQGCPDPEQGLACPAQSVYV